MGRSSWVIQVGPKCDHRCPCKRNVEGGLTERTGATRQGSGERKSHVYKEGVRSNNAGSFWKLEKASKQFLSLDLQKGPILLRFFFKVQLIYNVVLLLGLQQSYVCVCVYVYTSWRSKWQPTPVVLPGKPMDRGARQSMESRQSQT